MAARRQLRSPDGKPKVLAPVHPNQGLEAIYRRKLERLVTAMHRSVVYWLTARYRANLHRIAADASPAWELRREMEKLGKRWIDRFEAEAPELAKWFATAAKDRTDRALKETLKRAGFTVEFRPSRSVMNAYQATLAENVSLIKSIPQDYMTQVQGMVMRSVQTGRDLGTLTKDLEQRFGITHRRAAFIAQSQNNIATATITRERQRELGIVHAVWLHSHGGRHPRISHLAFSGKTYEVAKGAYLDGVWTFPGREPRCRCTCKSVIPGL